VQAVAYRELRPLLIEGGQRLDIDLERFPPTPLA
jgi:hypothetical protein